MLNDRKKEFRNLCIQKLKSISFNTKYYKNKTIIKNIYNLIKFNNAENILLYIPLNLEVNILPLINFLRKNKKNIYVPFIIQDGFKIVKFRLPLHKNKYNIKEPSNSFLKNRKIDLAVIPIVGIDALYKRIGYGKGMYDKFFYKLNYKPILVFTQLILFKSNNILTNKYDIKADFVITN